MKKFKNWLIDKLGGYTKEEIDPIIKENIHFAKDIKTLSNREDKYKEEIKRLNNLIEKDNEKDSNIIKVEHYVFDAVTLNVRCTDSNYHQSDSHGDYIKQEVENRLLEQAREFIDIKIDNCFDLVSCTHKKNYTATLVVGRKGSRR